MTFAFQKKKVQAKVFFINMQDFVWLIKSFNYRYIISVLFSQDEPGYSSYRGTDEPSSWQCVEAHT